MTLAILTSIISI
jgi:dynein heavy chain, axonemal